MLLHNFQFLIVLHFRLKSVAATRIVHLKNLAQPNTQTWVNANAKTFARVQSFAEETQSAKLTVIVRTAFVRKDFSGIRTTRKSDVKRNFAPPTKIVPEMESVVISDVLLHLKVTFLFGI
jgi:hypothetical protein